MAISTKQFFTIYLLLIIFFYDKTDGFNSQPNRLRYSFLKSLPVLWLSLAVHFGHGNMKGIRRHLLTAATLSGACGDFLISALHDMELSFALSSIVFAIGHVLYMAGFVTHVKRLSPKLAILIAAYALLMNYKFLLPNVTSHPITTSTLMVYSFILAFALLISGSLAFECTRFQPSGQCNNVIRFAGYILFFISDSLLLLEHAGLEFICCKELLILSTYYSAQYMIVTGALETEQLIY